MTRPGRMRAPARLWLIVILLLCIHLTSWATARALAPATAPPAISNVRILTPSVARFEKFEVQFDLITNATHPDLFFDANPPPGLTPGIGVTADALFSSDNWQTTIVQPAFLYQPFEYSVHNGRDHWVPDGAPRWLVRFAPLAGGHWEFRLKVQDAGGTAVFPAEGTLTFEVRDALGRYDGLRQNPYSRHGFLRVSPNDPRYFDFEDGTPFPGLGYNASVDTVAAALPRMRAFELNGIQFVRTWLSGSGINASQWTPWAFPQQPFNNGTPAVMIDSDHHLPGAEYSYRLYTPYPCLFADFWQNGIPVRPSTNYSVTVVARLDHVTAREGAASAGLTVARDGFLNNSCDELKGLPLFPPRLGTTDWFTATGAFTTGPDQYWQDYLYLALRNISSGFAYVASIRMVAQDDPAQVNVLRRPEADSHLYYDAMSAAKWDKIIESAEQHGVYLKLVADEKNEAIRNTIRADGTLGPFDNNDFYAAPNTKVRWLDEAWWRYLIARWGYSTAIHSFEFVNEGDPYNGNHYDAANAMAVYFREHDPSQHMVTTSFWHSLPNKEFWSNPAYSALSYADLHAYITTGWGKDASFVPDANLETRPQHVYSGTASFHIAAAQPLQTGITPLGVTLNEPGEWVIRYRMQAEQFAAHCSYGEGGSSQRVLWQLDGGPFSGGREGVVPGDSSGKTFICTSADGTYDWREFSSTEDRNGNPIPLEHRLVISDTLPHSLTLWVTNSGGIRGDAWIDSLELISPSGKRNRVLGEFDNTPFAKDTAWLSAAYSLLWGASSGVGVNKPLVRGETGANSAEFPNGFPDLNLDSEGVWLHNFEWGQINSGGMYDLWWWGRENIEDAPKSGRTGNLYGQFLTFATFMADVPINNGEYRDAQAQTSDPGLRAWGQRDDKNGRVHLWVQNQSHTWDNVVHHQPVPALNGSVTLSDLAAGTWRVDWWDTSLTRAQIFLSQSVEVSGTLRLTLPRPLTGDIGVKLTRVRP